MAPICKRLLNDLWARGDSLYFPRTLVPEERSKGAMPEWQAIFLALLMVCNSLVSIIKAIAI